MIVLILFGSTDIHYNVSSLPGMLAPIIPCEFYVNYGMHACLYIYLIYILYEACLILERTYNVCSFEFGLFPWAQYSLLKTTLLQMVESHSFNGWVIFHVVYVPCLLPPWAFGLFLYLLHCRSCWYKYSIASHLSADFASFEYIPRRVILGHAVYPFSVIYLGNTNKTTIPMKSAFRNLQTAPVGGMWGKRYPKILFVGNVSYFHGTF